MQFRVVQMRRRGVAVPRDQLRSAEPLIIDVLIEASICEELGRYSRVARCFSSNPGHEPLPRLFDAEINSMATLGMIITGTEIVDGVGYAQSWWCRVP
ncbi:MAG TPA: hypothetical protein EYH47_20495 [Pseudomonas oleovorans]|nr:hypothetical protein [Pseudomonas oleovorans]